YFGAFLGRLFTREWIAGVDDVERVLRGSDPANCAAERTGWGASVFRWLRENGRYLAPRGSGDIIVLGAVLLRNWIAVQVVLATTVLTVLVSMQVVRAAVDSQFAGGVFDTWLRWSPWLALPV